jgi:hypothetical protein
VKKRRGRRIMMDECGGSGEMQQQEDESSDKGQSVVLGFVIEFGSETFGRRMVEGSS